MKHNIIDKERQRVYGRSARRALGSGLAAKKSMAAISRILAHPAYLSAKVILAYRAHGDELCIDELCEMAILQGKQVAFPVCDGRRGMVAAVAPQPFEETDRYGITEPMLAHAQVFVPSQIDLVLVPGAAFDIQGRRVGWGGGYYDCYLSLCKRAFFMGVAFEEQILPEILSDSWDMNMHAVATDKTIYQA